MADQLFQPDQYGSVDDWGDFNVKLVDETLERHRIDPIESSSSTTTTTRTRLRRGNHVAPTGSSIWKNDGPRLESAEANEDVRGKRILKDIKLRHDFVDFPEATGDPQTMLEALHPLSSGLNDIGIENRESITLTTKERDLARDKSLTDSLKEKEQAVEDKAKSGLRNAKAEIREAADKTESTLHKAADKTENKIKSAAHRTEDALERAKDKTEYNMDRVKDKIENEWHKAKDEVRGMNDNIKENLSPQKDQPDVTVIENATVIVEDWDKHQEEKPSLWQRLTDKLHFGRRENNIEAPPPQPIATLRVEDMHQGPRILSSTPKNNSNLEIPPKETDAGSLDMVGAQKEKVNQFTVVNDKTSGGPWPASHIPTKLRVDQSVVEDLKSYSHGAYGQADKDYYRPKPNSSATGTSNTSR